MKNKVWVLLLADSFCKADAGSEGQFMAVRSYEGAIVEPVQHNDLSKNSITEQKYKTLVLKFHNIKLKISMKIIYLLNETSKPEFCISVRLCYSCLGRYAELARQLHPHMI